MTGTGAFVDTSVVLYLLSDDARKADRSEGLLVDGVTCNVQVLNETTNVLRRKTDMDWLSIGRFVERLKAVCEVRPLTLAVHDDGRRLAERYRFSTYDALIVAAALESGATRLWSEDMQNGLLVDGTLTIANPYSHG